MCRWKRYGFQAIWSGLGSSNHRKLVWYRVPFNGIAHKRLKSKTVEHFCSHWYRVTKFAKFILVKGRTFAYLAAHPHPNYMRILPPGLRTSYWRNNRSKIAHVWRMVFIEPKCNQTPSDLGHQRHSQTCKYFHTYIHWRGQILSWNRTCHSYPHYWPINQSSL